MPVVRFGEHHAGQECAERHRHAGLLHKEGCAQDHEQGGGGHHLARAGLGEQSEEWVEQVAPGDDDQCDRGGNRGDRAQAVAEAALHAIAFRGEQRQGGEQRHHRHILEQQDREGALPIILLELAALFQDLQCDRGRRHRERQAGDDGAAPVDQACGAGERADHDSGEAQLRHAQPENGAAHRDQPPQFELEPDQEQQHYHAELGNRNDALGCSECGEPRGADDDAGDEIGDDGRQSDAARDRHAQHRGREQHQSERQEAEFTVLLIHPEVRA